MAGRPPSTLSTAITAAVQSDTQLAQEARALAHKAIAIANEYLDKGSPKTQMEVIKSIMPAIGRGLSEQGESQALSEMREQLANLMATVRGDSLAS